MAFFGAPRSHPHLATPVLHSAGKDAMLLKQWCARNGVAHIPMYSHRISVQDVVTNLQQLFLYAKQRTAQ